MEIEIDLTGKTEKMEEGNMKKKSTKGKKVALPSPKAKAAPKAAPKASVPKAKPTKLAKPAKPSKPSKPAKQIKAAPKAPAKAPAKGRKAPAKAGGKVDPPRANGTSIKRSDERVRGRTARPSGSWSSKAPRSAKTSKITGKDRIPIYAKVYIPLWNRVLKLSDKRGEYTRDTMEYVLEQGLKALHV